MEEPAGFNVTASAPGGISGAAHMGREIRNPGGIQASEVGPRLEAVVISFGSAEMFSPPTRLIQWQTYASVTPLSLHIWVPLQTNEDRFSFSRSTPQRGVNITLAHTKRSRTRDPSIHNRRRSYLRDMQDNILNLQGDGRITGPLGQGERRNRHLISS